MKRLVGTIICSLVMTVGLMATPAAAEPHGWVATPAAAEPHGWNLYCRSGTGIYSYVTRPEECRQGNVQFLSWTTGAVDFNINVWAIEMRIGKGTTLNELYSACSSNVICGIALAGVEGIVLSKVKAAWIALKRLMGR